MLSRLWTALVLWYRRREDIRRLSLLDDHLLRDIGVERCDIRHVVDGLAVPPPPPADTETAYRQVFVLRPNAGRRALR